MQSTGLALSLLAIVACQTAAAMFNRCSNGDACVDIRNCDRFGPYHTEPSKWSAMLKEDFRTRVCQRESINGVNVFKVCCPPARGLKTRLDLLDLERCGAYSDDRIAFGKNARLFQFPWMALLRSRGHWICGGTLINERYVLTAAHCVHHRAIDYVRLGELELNQAIDCDLRQEVCAPEPQDITVERVIIHEEYSVRRRVNDIALLRLARPATLHESVVPICLPVAPAMQTKLSTYYVAGWGSTQNAISSNKLQFTELNLMPNDECLTRLHEEDKYMRLFDTQVCAIGARALSDNCVGDSGGPLKSVSVSARFVQYGVVSYGLNSCGKKSAPGVYTRVESYIDWILDRLEA